MTLEQAYRTCREIARREARNFYFAFLALPAHKRNAICAVYAFMRKADDLADDESITRPERRRQMAEWLAAWRHAAETGSADDPVFYALNDARVRFRIPLALLDQLVEGTALDLREEHDAEETFADFESLRRYCYLVASVVGLVCIRIFEYRSVRAEALAEELGLALQLTNILRDVKEDAERGRVYLPVDELAQHGFTPESLSEFAKRGAAPTDALRAMLREQADRAARCYEAGEKLLPLVAPDSRPALWVLMTIYHRLLGRIERADYDVFTHRAAVPTWEKLWLLGRGLARTTLVRLGGARRKRANSTAAVTDTSRRVAIIGAGVAGLSAGAALSNAGYSVTVFERRPYVGGRASSYLHPGSGEVIDNCQHILLGCCTNLRSLLARVGRSDSVAWTRGITYIEPGGRRSVIRPTALPAPLHAAISFQRAACFSKEDKRAIANALKQFLHGYPADVPGGESFLAWATRNGQTHGAIKRFWEPILQSALNDDLDRISLHYAGMVIRDSFMNSAEAGEIGVPLLPLSDLYAAAADNIAQHGGAVHLRHTVRAMQQGDNGWLLDVEQAGELQREQFDDVVVALPFEAAGKLLATLPESTHRDALLETISGFVHAPLAGIHLWFDREITELPHAVLLDTTIQWMYQREKLNGQASSTAGSHLELVISAAYKVAAMPQAKVIELALRELALFFPAVREATLLKAVVTKEVRATFTVSPGLDARRPSQRTAWPGLHLAGDWTDTGWPATMEGAARSGFLAAEAVTGGTQEFVAADLPPRGLMRLLSL